MFTSSGFARWVADTRPLSAKDQKRFITSFKLRGSIENVGFGTPDPLGFGTPDPVGFGTPDPVSSEISDL